MDEQSPAPIGNADTETEGGQEQQGGQQPAPTGSSFLGLGLTCCGPRTDPGGRVKERKASLPQPQAEALKTEVAKTEAQRKNSLTDVEKNLSEIKEKLSSAEGKMAPWGEVKGAKAKLESLQREVGEQISDAEQKLAEAPPEEGGLLETFTEVPALRKELSEKQLKRKQSLTEVSESLAAIGAKLDGASSSWKPSTDIQAAKREIEGVQTAIGQEDAPAAQEETAGEEKETAGEEKTAPGA